MKLSSRLMVGSSRRLVARRGLAQLLVGVLHAVRQLAHDLDAVDLDAVVERFA
ncbi:MAG: hypothetical protein LCH95_09240 [Proteobacteria bacterium]|nr:hypothetical protein [Pseudomonadota bacterium]